MSPVNMPFNKTLLRAVLCGRPDVVRLLLEQGVDPNARDEHGRIVLDYAIRAGQKEIAEILREAGKKPFNCGGFSWY